MFDADIFWLGLLIGIAVMLLGALAALKRENPDYLRRRGIWTMGFAIIVTFMSAGVLKLMWIALLAGVAVTGVSWTLAIGGNHRSISVISVFILLESMGIIVISGLIIFLSPG